MNKPFKCEFGHVQSKKCNQGHPVYSHKTKEGWCCACEGDIAFASSWLVENVTRFEVIDHSEPLMDKSGNMNRDRGRVLTKYGVKVELELQDDDRTLKILIGDRQ